MDFSFDLTSRVPTVAALLLALFVGKIVSGLLTSKKKKRLPPVAGTIFHQLINFKRLHDFNTELCHKYKTYRLLTPTNKQVYTSDPANIEYILRTNFNNYGKGSFNYENSSDLFGDGIFAVDGDKWRHQRKIASYEFSTRVLRDFSSTVFKINAAKLAQIISEISNRKEVIDIQDLFMKSTMDSIFKVGFGIELNSLQGSEEGNRFSNAFDRSSSLILLRYVDPFWKIKKYFNIGSEAELKKHIKIVNDFVYKLINVKIENPQNPEIDSVKKEDLLSRFLAEMEKDPENMTHKYLRDIILNFLIAGKDTTAGTLSWFIYMLCKNQQIQDKVACEVQEATENDKDTNFGDFSNLLTDEVVDKMQYLHATITETLRLFPSVPLDSKVCFSDDTLPDGFDTEKGDVVFYMPYAMGRLTYLWGEDAEVFRPDRWIDANGYFQPESPFKFTAFQAGPRIC
ncbi:cytochrome P450 704C1-like [Asparagus officinalis]|uniref:cytochrome P450 704C1-like n=1 Tax=Asparagus officinalis TaxID=4686 RepID=UPI00098E600A|nr:cytochrome P450 704C1-like [Asparagus officinalis]